MVEETRWPRRVFTIKPAAMGKTELVADLDVTFGEAVLASDFLDPREQIWAKVAEANEARAQWLDDRLKRLLAEGAQRDEIVVEHHQDGITAIVWKGVQRYRFKVTFEVPDAEAGL